ncbi:glycosyltransferase [Sulfurimonas sp.]
MGNNLYPIIIFTYRRIPKELIQSLLKNSLAKDSELYIFSDGSKNKYDYNDIVQVRNFLKGINGFKNITLIESEVNKGLANSIIYGVTKIINEYDRVIVLEDDLVVSKDFLEYMNEALDFYKDDNKIWSISGYSPNLHCLKNYDKDVYLSVRANSWGWATWKDRWDSIDWNVKDWNEFKKNKKSVSNFMLGGNDMFKMLELQMLGKIDSWAIRWCYNQFKQNRYTVYPKNSKVLNDGFNDEKATHNNGKNDKWKIELNNEKINFVNLFVKEEILQCFKIHYNITTITQVGYFLKKYGGYKVIKNLRRLKEKYVGKNQKN